MKLSNMESSGKVVQVLEPDILKEIDEYLEEIYPQSMNIGSNLEYHNFSNSQIRNLQTMVLSATRFSEIINFIKNQAGKDKKGQWSLAAPVLLEQLKLIEVKAREIGNLEPGKVLEVKIRMARGWVKQVVAHFLYASSIKQG